MESQIPLRSSKNKPSWAGKLDRTEKIFAEHGSFIRTAIRFHIKDEAACDDLFQDFFLSLVINPVPKDVKNMRGFLYRAVTYRSKDAFRRVTRYRTILRGYAEKWQRRIEDSPEVMAIEREEVEKVLELIHKHLPKKEAMAMSLKYGKDGDTEDVAESMGVKSATVSRYVCAGAKKIRNILKREGRL